VQSIAPHLDQQFAEPDWAAPLDTGSAIQAMPQSATISGMFLDATLSGARKARLPLSSDWPAQYSRFRFYPMRDHARLLAEIAPLMFPDVPIRQALRVLGRTAPSTLLGSTVGKVVLGSAEGVHEIIETITKTYPINLKPSSAEIVERGAHHTVVRLTDVHFFLDCHHVGVLEGTMRHAGVKGSARVRPLGRGAMDFLLSW
jgi:uncharacterized protein (TIGR02265 family)